MSYLIAVYVFMCSANSADSQEICSRVAPDLIFQIRPGLDLGLQIRPGLEPNVLELEAYATSHNVTM